MPAIVRSDITNMRKKVIILENSALSLNYNLLIVKLKVITTIVHLILFLL